MKKAIERKDNEDLFKFFNNHQNEIVINCIGKLVKLLRMTESNKDYYWYCRDFRGTISYLSCNKKLISLKDKINDSDYKLLEEVYKLNVYPVNVNS